MVHFAFAQCTLRRREASLTWGSILRQAQHERNKVGGWLGGRVSAAALGRKCPSVSLAGASDPPPSLAGQVREAVAGYGSGVAVGGGAM